jgi:hypothetical protein
LTQFERQRDIDRAAAGAAAADRGDLAARRGGRAA